MAAEKKIDEMQERLQAARPQEVRWIDPYKMAFWNLETAIQMADGTVSRKTIDRAIKTGELNAYKTGKEIALVPSEFILWLKRGKV